MNVEFVQQVYDLMCGNIRWEAGLPEVPDAFAEGQLCAALYKDIYMANIRLCERLNAGDDDADVEIIINSFLRINEELCKRMFQYAMRYGKEAYKADPHHT